MGSGWVRSGFTFRGRVGFGDQNVGDSPNLPSGFGFLRLKVRVGLVWVLLFGIVSGSGIKMSGIFPSGFGFSGP